MKISWFPNVPSTSPSAVPALGFGLCINTLMLLAVYVLMSRFSGSQDELIQIAQKHMMFGYAAFALVPAVSYGFAAAAWTGWSWWRVPPATAAGCVLGWCTNVLLVSFWAHMASWPTQSSFAWGGPHTRSIISFFVLCLLVIVAIGATLLTRYLPARQEEEIFEGDVIS